MLRCVDYENTMDAEIKVIILPEGKDPDEVIKEDPSVWQDLAQKAIPALDFTVDTVVAGLDLNKTGGKAAATSKLLPVIARLKDPLRQDHYLNRLAALTGISYTRLENALAQQLPRPAARAPSPKTDKRPSALFSNPIEEDCLVLLLKHPELKNVEAGLLCEHFENSAHREIFAAWQASPPEESDDPAVIRSTLDESLWEYLDALIKVDKPMLATRIEERYNAYVLRLREEHFRRLERKRAAVLAHEAEEKGEGADLAKLREDGIEVSAGLKEVFSRKASTSPYRRQRRF
jgi:DNA primase